MTRVGVVLAAIVLVAPGGAGNSFAQTRGRPSQRAHALRAKWTTYVAKGATLNPTPRFAMANRAAIERVVERSASRFHYVAKRVSVLKGHDGSPLVVVRVTRGPPVRFSRSFPTLWRRLDPLIRAEPDWHAYKYEAFFFEAVDARGTPFLIIWNAWRRPPRGGGQWARTEALLPFPHG